MEKQLPIRKPLRMSHYDYNVPGAYFLTFCTHKRKPFLSHIAGAIPESPKLQLTDLGMIVEEIILYIPEHLHVTIDQHVIMPNHVHLIAIITEEDPSRTIPESSPQGRSTISKLVGYIKANTSKMIRRRYGNIDVWQRGYYDHVIRNHEDYVALAEYVQTNPLRWKLDKLYSEE